MTAAYKPMFSVGNISWFNFTKKLTPKHVPSRQLGNNCFNIFKIKSLIHLGAVKWKPLKQPLFRCLFSFLSAAGSPKASPRAAVPQQEGQCWGLLHPAMGLRFPAATKLQRYFPNQQHVSQDVLLENRVHGFFHWQVEAAWWLPVEVNPSAWSTVS